MKYLVAIVLFLQVVLAGAQDVPIGSYNPEEDETVENYSGLEGALIWFADNVGSLFATDDPEGYADGPFSDFFTYLASVAALIAFHFLHAKVFYRRKRTGTDVAKIIYRYKVLITVFAVLMTLTLMSTAFIWGLILAVTSYIYVRYSIGKMASHLCPHCCRYIDPEKREESQPEFATEVYGLKTFSSQYLKLEDITEKTLPEGGYKLYAVQKYHYYYRCPECDVKWREQEWKRLKKLHL